MTTSDSEDFESADEEFESAHSVKQKSADKKESKNSKEKICESSPCSEPIVLNKDDSKALTNSKADNLINETVLKNVIEGSHSSDKVFVTDKPNQHCKTSSTKETGKSEILDSSNRRVTNLERQSQKKTEVKQKTGSKKLGMKLSNVKEDVIKSKRHVELSQTDIDKKMPTIDKNITNDSEITQLVETLTLESKSTKESRSEVESLKESSSKYTKSIKISNPDSKISNVSSMESQSTKVEESKSIKSSSVERQLIKESSSDQDVMIKSASGDGWEVEEEDGFEVPVSLSNKPKNEIIQSEREISPVLERLSATASQPEAKGQGWGSWGGWGVTSLLSTATESVSTFSSHVTSGFSTVLESSLGVPDPEELAKHVVQEEKEMEPSANKSEEPILTAHEDAVRTEGLGFSGLGSLMSGVGLLGTKVLSGGLDTLETLGKKTMEVLQDGDPMLRKKRAMLFADPDKPVLSQILKEAKEKAENSDKEQAEKESSRKAHFETLFDDYQGLVHLEALEMLSKQCQLKLQSILLSFSGNELVDLQETLSEVKELCELPEDEDDEEVLSKEEFEIKIAECMKNLHANLYSSKIVQVYDAIDKQLKELASEKIPAVELHQKAISSMAEFTAYAMECFHKGAELVLTKSHRSTADEAENFVQLTTTFCSQVSYIASEFTSLLTKWDPVANSTYITNIFLEAKKYTAVDIHRKIWAVYGKNIMSDTVVNSDMDGLTSMTKKKWTQPSVVTDEYVVKAGNSGSYIQNACQLLLPVIQVGAAS